MSESEQQGLSQDDINAALAAAGLSSHAVSGSTDAEAPDEPEAIPDVPAASSAPAPTPTHDPVATHGFDIPELDPSSYPRGAAQGIDLLRDVELNVKIELGRSRMLVDEVLQLGEGAVVELDKLAGDPVDVVNNRLVARGEVLVLNDNFCVRINEIVAQQGEEAWV